MCYGDDDWYQCIHLCGELPVDPGVGGSTSGGVKNILIGTTNNSVKCCSTDGASL